MELSSLSALSPLDGRYHSKLEALRPFLSEYGLIQSRVEVEIHWLRALSDCPEIEACQLTPAATDYLTALLNEFDEQEALRIKTIEQTTQHDVKAVEYYLAEKLSAHRDTQHLISFIHFACTSEDINNLAYSLMLKKARENVLLPIMQSLISDLKNKAEEYASIAMLARTHGQAATPTTLGKELANVVARLTQQYHAFESVSLMGKCNGAVGNFNAHISAYPEVDWLSLSKKMVTNLGLEWNAYTTQIEPHDRLAELLHALSRFNTVLIDFNRDTWSYISLGYFRQKSVKSEVGSSTMPHKVNPIDFENAEGNLGIANALALHLATTLPISRWQRDLTDSTVLRNLSSVFAHSLLAYQGTQKGLHKIDPDAPRMEHELNQHWEVLAEPIQTIMRRHGIADAYDILKDLTRGKPITSDTIEAFIDQLALPSDAKKALCKLTPSNYLGLAATLAQTMDDH